MKKLLAILLAALLVLSLAACGGKTEPEPQPAQSNTVIRLSTTTSVNDSGLLPYLLPVFEQATGYTVEVQSAGTGAAIQKAIDGNADLILVHAKASEEEFIAGGYGVERLPFMYNYFVIVGPKDDPAGIADCEDAAAAFAKIRESENKFVSRGDESGTHKAELKIWGENAPDAANDSWYISAGQGMGACCAIIVIVALILIRICILNRIEMNRIRARCFQLRHVNSVCIRRAGRHACNLTGNGFIINSTPAYRNCSS